MNLSIKLPDNPKIWLCGVTGDREKDIEELTRDIAQYFEGLIWVDHFSQDNTAKILEERKGAGTVLFRKYTDDHDLQRNEFLRCGLMKSFDWFCYIDSGERLNIEWCKSLKSTINEYQRLGIGVGMLGRPYLVQYFDDMIFSGNPHCWPYPLRGKTINLDETFIKKKVMDERSGLLHPFHYYWNTPRSNELFAQYRKYGQDVVDYRENLRFQFRLYWQQNLGLEFTMDSVIKFLQNIYDNRGQIDKLFFEYMETEFYWSDIFRLKILKQRFYEDIVPNRFAWSFKKWLNDGDERQLNSDYKGTILIYNEKYNIKLM